MTVAEYIVELQKLDQTIPVFGESETGTWQVESEDIYAMQNIVIAHGPERNLVTGRYEHMRPNDIYPVGLVVGYTHGRYEPA
jgi:hypothetical protein